MFSFTLLCIEHVQHLSDLPVFGLFIDCVYCFVFFGVVVFSIFVIFCTAVNDSTEQAQRNKKEACTVTDTVTVVKGIPCACK